MHAEPQRVAIQAAAPLRKDKRVVGAGKDVEAHVEIARRRESFRGAEQHPRLQARGRHPVRRGGCDVGVGGAVPQPHPLGTGLDDGREQGVEGL